MDFKGP